jgi:hypothetical protein
MPFQYYGGGGGGGMQPLGGLQYNQQQQQQQESPFSQIDPKNITSAYKMYQTGGSGAGGGAVTGGTQFASAGSAGTGGGMAGGPSMAGGSMGTSAGGTAGGAGGSSGGSMVASAGPWAALAAVIYANEYNAKKGGYRAESKGEYTRDLFSGEVLQQDLSKRWLPKLGLKEGSKESKWATHLIQPWTADPEKSWKRLKDLF